MVVVLLRVVAAGFVSAARLAAVAVSLETEAVVAFLELVLVAALDTEDDNTALPCLDMPPVSS